MNGKTESAELILKLYELRREEKMREARNWMMTFFPDSADDVLRAIMNPETSAFYRMVVSYWEMAASFVVNGAIDETMFTDANAEHFVVFAKIELFLPELKEMMGNPNMLKNLETLVMRQPDAKERLAKSRESMKRVMEARKQMSQSAQ